MNKTLALCVSTLAAGLLSVQAHAASQVDALNELLTGEISAVQTYQQALEKVGPESGATSLKAALLDHQVAVKDIGSEVLRLKGTPSQDSGAWGTWAKTVTGAAKLLGDEAALKALKEGEQHGVKEYQEILQNTSVSDAFKQKVRSEYLPQQQKHIASIDQLMQGIEMSDKTKG